MKSITKKIGSIALAACMMFSVAACDNGAGPGGGPDDNGKPTTTFDNEKDPLLLSTLEVDGVFNPFFASSGTDSSVVGMTQLGMLTSTDNGEVAYGEDEDTLVLDYEDVLDYGANGPDHVDLDHDTRTTTFYFVLKNDVKFSNGTPVTIKDVLFNLYVYLDMAYTGSATIYSTDIIGLQEYRTQADSETEQESFLSKYQARASARIEALLSAWESLGYDRENSNKKPDSDLDENQLKTAFEEIAAGGNATYQNLVADYAATCRLFKEELQNDFNGAKDSASDIVFKDKNGKLYEKLLTTDVEAFLYNEGKITWNKDYDGRGNGRIETAYTNNAVENDWKKLKDWTETQAINRVYLENIPDKLGEVVQFWGTASTLFEELTNAELEKDSATAGSKKHKNISGIKFANGGEERGGADSVTVKGKTYTTPTYNADGSVASGNEVLSIQIKGVDPKAKWNFAFTVAPMYYYSTPELANAFDYVENFGVRWNSQSFMNTVVKDPAKIGVPVGAGPYMASKESGGTSNVAAGDFRRNGVIYYERNPYYLKNVKIKKVRYVVVASSQMTTDLYSGRVDYSEPNAKPETIEELNKKKNEVSYLKSATNGYGYIGINASKIPYLNVRRAIMYSINTKLCVDYYKSEALDLHRSMSRSSDYYPEDATAYYPYIGGEVPARLDTVDPAYKAYVELTGKKAGQKFSKAEQITFIDTLLNNPSSLDSTSYSSRQKYRFDKTASGVYEKAGSATHYCRYTFTIAGEQTDHPAFQALYDAMQFLNECGFEVTVRTDSQALQKLASGQLTVWAAAWSSTIDPDMYQVYHKDSKASSVQNWGYPAILRNAGDLYSKENEILSTLSTYIEQGRQYDDKAERKKYYTPALNKVMELAIELPTYQRNDLFAYDPGKIDSTTLLTPSSYRSPLSELYNVSLVVKNEIA